MLRRYLSALVFQKDEAKRHEDINDVVKRRKYQSSDHRGRRQGGDEQMRIVRKFVSFLGKTVKESILSTLLVDKCNKLYIQKPDDDTTACTVKIRKREPVNILFGPPSNPDDCDRMMSLFFSEEGKHIICGGTTASIAAKYLRKPLRATLKYENPDVPPIAELEGVELVTEGIVTMNKVIEYVKDYLSKNKTYKPWSFKKDGASLICQLLFEEATDINLYVGCAINPAHQNPDLPINFNVKTNLVEELSKILRMMGKRIKTSYF